MKKSLYRIYNLNLDLSGEPFAMCEKDFKAWKVNSEHLIVQEIGKETSLPCNECGK